MDTTEEILRSLGRIEGELIEIRKLSERVRKLEILPSWLKGGWAVLVTAWLYLWRSIAGPYVASYDREPYKAAVRAFLEGA